MKIKILIKSSVLITFLFVTSGFAQENKKSAQTGMQFLSVETDARAAALGRSVTTIGMESSSLFYNPAGLAYLNGLFDVALSINNWIADISHDAVSAAVKPWKGKYGVIGLSLITIDYGDIQGTRRADNDQGYIKTEILQPTAYALGFGYARSLTDKFSVGGQVKFVRQELGHSTIPVTDSTTTKATNKVSPISFDFGTIFKTGYKSLKFGMFVRNFSNEIEYVKEGFQLPLEFSIGISMNVFDFFENVESQTLFISVDAVHYRSHPEEINFGAEYMLSNMFALRVGCHSNSDENNFSFGLGIKKYGIAFDYAYTPFGVFNDVQRFTVRFSM